MNNWTAIRQIETAHPIPHSNKSMATERWLFIACFVLHNVAKLLYLFIILPQEGKFLPFISRAQLLNLAAKTNFFNSKITPFAFHATVARVALELHIFFCISSSFNWFPKTFCCSLLMSTSFCNDWLCLLNDWTN